jgi:ABC-type transport system substrate-binding protein
MKGIGRKFLFLLLTASVIGGLMTGCGKTKSGGKNILVLGAFGDFKQGSGTEGQSLVFDTMTNLNEKMEVLPNIVSWTSNEDASVYTLKVEKNVKFSDGTPLTSEIIEYSLKAWAPFRDGSYMYYLDSTEALDATTLKVKMKQGYGNLPIELTRIYVSLPDSLDDKGNVKNWTGTGPFILDDYKLEQSAFLKTNRNYWNSGRMPKIDGLKWLVIPDENARALALQSGEVDALGVSEHYCALPYATVADFIKDGKFSVDLQQDLGLISTYIYNYKKGPMKDINLRKAVTYAIDRDAIAKTIIFNVGKASGDFMTRAVNYAPLKETAYVYDIAKAKEALKAGGYADTNGDGIVEKNGQALKLSFIVESGETSRSVAVFVKECLSKAGIDTDMQVLDMSAFSTLTKNGNFDISYTHPWLATPQTYMSWRGAVDAYDDFGIGFGVSGNFGKYLNTMLTTTDTKILQRTFDDIWKEEYSFFPGTGLFVQPRAFIHKKNITGFIFNPSTEKIDLSGVMIK